MNGEYASEMKQLNDQLAGEAFSAGFSSGMSNAEWDLLVDRGAGGRHIPSKWERESLYLKFDPLLSVKERSQQLQQSHQPERLSSFPEQSFVEDESQGFNEQREFKLITIDTTPPPTKNRPRVPKLPFPSHPHCELLQPEVHENANVATDLVPLTSDRANVIDAKEEIEIRKLQDALEQQAISFHDQLAHRTLQLKEIEATILAATKKLESEQDSSRVMRDYEKSVVALENEVDRIRKQIAQTTHAKTRIMEERDLASDDLRRAELAFSDLHSKYEKAKAIVANFKKNEETLNTRHEIMKLKLDHRDCKLKSLQDAVEDVIHRMRNDYESRIKSEDLESNRIRAQLRKLELRMSTLEKDLEQKDKENVQLSTLCDDLIQGQHN